MFVAAILALVVSMCLLVIRLWKGPQVFDRILAVNVFGTNIVLVIALTAFYKQTESYIDIALVYAFLNFVGTLALLRYTRYGTFKEIDETNE